MVHAARVETSRTTCLLFLERQFESICIHNRRNHSIKMHGEQYFKIKCILKLFTVNT